MSEAQNDQDKFVSAIAIAGASVPIVEGIVALSNGGVIGGIVGLGVSGLVWLAADEMAKKGRGLTLPATSLPRQRVARAGQPGVFARLLTGKDDRDEQPQPKDGRDDPQTEKLPEMQDMLPPLFPRYPEDETLRLGRVVETGQRFDPHFDNFFESGCFIAAVQGSGKSILVGRIIEQFGKCGGPSVVFDHKGEYWPITELPFINGLRAGSSSLVAKIGGDTFELTPQTADAFVLKVQTERKQAIIHLPSYGDNWIDRARIVSSVGLALMKYSRNEREQGRIPLPCMVVMDEAQLYIPQDQGLLPSEAQKRENAEILDTLNNSYYAMVSNGRSNGYCVVFATQSPTYVKKWAIKSCQFRVYMRATEFNDLNALEKIISPTIARREDIEVFGKGKGVAFGLTARPVVVQFDMKESRDLSSTPKRSQLRAPAQERMVLPQPQRQSAQNVTFTLEEALQLAQEHPGIDPMWFMSRIADYRETDALPEQETVPVVRSPYYPQSGALRVDQVPTMAQPVATYRQPVVHQDKDQAKIEKGLRLWNEGHTSVRKLEAASGWSNGETRRIIKLMEDRGLISRER